MNHILDSISSKATAYSNIEPLTDSQLKRCVTDLKTFYLKTLCQIRTNPLDLNSMVELESIFTNLYLEGGEDKLALDYKDLLTTEVNGRLPNRILIQGEAGAGKTTLGAKIAWDWVNNVRYQEITLLPVVLLREVKNEQTIGRILKTYMSNGNDVTGEQLDHYIASNQGNVLTVLDGFDELSVDVSTRLEDIVQIIYCEKHENSKVIVTTRPWRAHLLTNSHDHKEIYARVRVEGFTRKNVFTYIKKFFTNDKSAAKDLTQYLKEGNLIADIMAPFPIFCSMLCHMWKEVERRQAIRKLQTFSQVFSEMISFLKDHHVSKQYHASQTVEIVGAMKQIDVHFKDISRIAFSGLLENQLNFDGQAFESCRDAQITACEVGILTYERGLSLQGHTSDFKRPIMASNVSFPHKLFQEFMAGLHLVTLFQSDVTEYNRIMTSDILPKAATEFRYVLYFAGSQFKDVGADIVTKLTTNSNPTKLSDFIVEVAFESYNEENARTVEANLSEHLKAVALTRKMSAHVIAGYLFILSQVVRLSKDFSLYMYYVMASSFMGFCMIKSGNLVLVVMASGVNQNQFYARKLRSKSVREHHHLLFTHILDKTQTNEQTIGNKRTNVFLDLPMLFDVCINNFDPKKKS